MVYGLSPRVRGNPWHHATLELLTGSIPACAGEPQRTHAAQSQRAVYPRVCGGTNLLIPAFPEHEGLSPRVRGNPEVVRACAADRRSIPACAGEPSAAWDGSKLDKVYPRVCGGTGHSISASTHLSGLSPRVRGNRRRLAPRPASKRSIPACAGEPFCDYFGGGLHGVYPRVCGGTASGAACQRWLPGLSPRVRGNLIIVPPGARRRRSIPACAGEPFHQPV